MGIISVTPPRPAHLMGMDKNGNQLIVVNTWTKLTAWTPRSGFGFTDIVNDALRIDGPGIRNINFRGDFTAIGGVQEFQAYINGNPIGTAAGDGVPTTISNWSFAGGELLELWAWVTGTLARTVAGGAANTHIYLS